MDNDVLIGSQMSDQLLHASHSFTESNKNMNHHRNHLQAKKTKKPYWLWVKAFSQITSALMKIPLLSIKA